MHLLAGYVPLDPMINKGEPGLTRIGSGGGLHCMHKVRGRARGSQRASEGGTRRGGRGRVDQNHHQDGSLHYVQIGRVVCTSTRID